jgi:Fic family protein
MDRKTGEYRISRHQDEQVRAFLPHPLPPDPPLNISEGMRSLLHLADAEIRRLDLAGKLVPSPKWFIYSFVRKEALLSSQIEGTQATLEDVLNYEAGEKPKNPDDVQEVCNYIAALEYARKELANPKGLPLSIRLLRETHKRLMKGVRGDKKNPGEIRTSQNWIGGSRPGNAKFVPLPPVEVPELLSSLEKWIHHSNDYCPLIRIGLAHAQFETIHPFLDGNGRIGRLLIALLMEHWKLLHQPLLYLSVVFKRYQSEYYERLNDIRIHGNWEGWIEYFLECVGKAAGEAVDTAERIFALTSRDRDKVLKSKTASVPAIRLLERLLENPIVTLPSSIKLLGAGKPTVIKALDVLVKLKILRETTGKMRDRIYHYHEYLVILKE